LITSLGSALRTLKAHLGLSEAAVREPGGRTSIGWPLLCCSVQRTTEYLAPLKKRGVSISMDGRGRALDNVFIERLWRGLKCELIYPGDFANGAELIAALDHYFHFYNHRRPHQALGYRTPANLFPRRSIRKKSSL
jgi:transposase InsO family protein